jgi:hypothetical protein
MSLAVRARKSESARSSKALAPAKAAASGLKIGQPDSAFEHEADHMADEIMATSTPRLHWSLSKITTPQSKGSPPRRPRFRPVRIS